MSHFQVFQFFILSFATAFLTAGCGQNSNLVKVTVSIGGVTSSHRSTYLTQTLNFGLPKNQTVDHCKQLHFRLGWKEGIDEGPRDPSVNPTLDFQMIPVELFSILADPAGVSTEEYLTSFIGSVSEPSVYLPKGIDLTIGSNGTLFMASSASLAGDCLESRDINDLPAYTINTVGHRSFFFTKDTQITFPIYAARIIDEVQITGTLPKKDFIQFPGLPSTSGPYSSVLGLSSTSVYISLYNDPITNVPLFQKLGEPVKLEDPDITYLTLPHILPLLTRIEYAGGIVRDGLICWDSTSTSGEPPVLQYYADSGDLYPGLFGGDCIPGR